MILARIAIRRKRKTKLVQADRRVDRGVIEKKRKARTKRERFQRIEREKTDGRINTKINQRRKAVPETDQEERTNPKRDVVDHLIMIMNEK